jgi:enamine deaminase RidA (YjgF/YER057c/UK114 family)
MSDDRQLITSGSPFEVPFGFSRAVRVGTRVWVAGTAPIGPDGKTVGVGDAAAQARQCFAIIRAALEAAQGSLADVVRTRVLLTHIEDWTAVTAVHGELFAEIRPACTVMQVVRFVDPEWRVEIEVDAVLGAAKV